MSLYMEKFSLVLCVMQHKVSLTPARSQLPHFVTSEQPQLAQPVLSPGHRPSTNTEQAAALELPWLQCAASLLAAGSFNLCRGSTLLSVVLCLEHRACASRGGVCAVMGKRPFGIPRGTGTGTCATAAAHPGSGEGETSNRHQC